MQDIDIQGGLLRKITVGSFDNNVYFLLDPTSKESIIIDAAAEAEPFFKPTATWTTSWPWTR
jgi:hypothetical protein